MNIIGDVAGRFDELMLLLIQMPKDEPIVLVGDLVDRGPKSKEVIEWAMNTPNVITLKGNHEDMLVRASKELSYGDEFIWKNNGGDKTLLSYGVEKAKDIPKEYIEWMDKLPLKLQRDELYVTHAPQVNLLNTDLWNREVKRIEGVFQIFGHNGRLKVYDDYAICIDNSMNGRLFGIHWPDKRLYHQDYIYAKINPEN